MDPVLDFDHLAAYTGGDAALEAEVFGLFREQTELWLRLLTPDSTAEDWRAAAHSLKGSARGIGAFALAARCEAAELATEGSRAARALAAEEVRQAAHAALDAASRRDYRREINELKSAGF